ALEQYEFAAMCYSACISLRPDFAPAWMNRGIAFAGLRFRDHAFEDYAQALKIDPTLTDVYVYRAEAREAERDFPGAEDDYTRALDSGTAPARIYFLRARVRHYRGNTDGARADLDAGYRVTPTDELSWIAWAENCLGDDPKRALEYVEKA